MATNSTTTQYLAFISQLSELANSHSSALSDLLGNILSMREIGNKTHGDIAEVALTHFVNTFMSENYEAKHVGKANFRSKSKEEDIEVTELSTNSSFTISVKAYGKGPLQLSTDKRGMMFRRLEMEQSSVDDPKRVKKILRDSSFESINDLNLLAIIYDENKMKARLMSFNFNQAIDAAHSIARIESGTGRRKHPAYIFSDKNDKYLFEVRYGRADSNALQRGLWTNTNKNQDTFFHVTQDWIAYTINHSLNKIISSLFVLNESKHEQLLTLAKELL